MLVLGCVAAPAAFAAPDFTFDPPSPVACEQVTFTPSVDTEGAMWDYENNDTFVSDLTHAFQTEGTHTVEMTSTNGLPITHDVVVANAPPVASFDYSPTEPDPDEWIVFTSAASSDCDDSVTGVEWDFDADGITDSTEPNPVHKFSTPGPHEVTLTVTDEDTAQDSDTQVVDVRDPSVPTADFHRDPDDSVLLQTGDEATFSSDSVAAAGSTFSWEIDGVVVGSGTSVTHTFTTNGNHVVRLTVEQPNGKSDDDQSTFRVNAPPVAGFVWTPGSPLAGADVQLFSTSVDAEGSLGSLWDLDGDGQFDDASGAAATASFSAGDHQVSLRVTDGDGVSRAITRTITVAAAPIVITSPPAELTPPAETTPAPVKPALMSPFPTVRLVGFVVPRGARISLVEVRSAPRGARVTVRCSGQGCPFSLRRRVAETGRVRLSAFRQVLVAGARIQVFVRAPGVIGRFVGFRIRAGKRPLRAERCLMPGPTTEPTRCT
jgi:PKD repeat protein